MNFLDFTEDVAELLGVQGAAVPKLAPLDRLELATVLGGNTEVERLAGHIGLREVTLKR